MEKLRTPFVSIFFAFAILISSCTTYNYSDSYLNAIELETINIQIERELSSSNYFSFGDKNEYKQFEIELKFLENIQLINDLGIEKFIEYKGLNPLILKKYLFIKNYKGAGLYESFAEKFDVSYEEANLLFSIHALSKLIYNEHQNVNSKENFNNFQELTWGCVFAIASAIAVTGLAIAYPPAALAFLIEKGLATVGLICSCTDECDQEL